MQSIDDMQGKFLLIQIVYETDREFAHSHFFVWAAAAGLILRWQVVNNSYLLLDNTQLHKLATAKPCIF